MKTPNIIGLTPFERPDVSLALALIKAKAFPVLHLGHNEQSAIQAINELAQKTEHDFGVCFGSTKLNNILLPDQVTLIIAPYGTPIPKKKNTKVYYQIHTLAEAQKAQEEHADGIIVKGNEGAGKVADESTFILFQRIIQQIKNMPIWVQGGAGVHTSAALIAMGATGIIMDSQLALFPECSIPDSLKEVCKKLNGNETRVIDGFRVLVRPNSPSLPDSAKRVHLEHYLNTIDLEKGYLPMGQDIAISIDLANRYKKLDRMVSGMNAAILGHLKQAKTLNVISPNNALAKSLNIDYPIAQGPMTRVSDVPEFAEAVANAGALPFVALSLMKGESAKELIQNTKKLLGTRTWGVGILGFAPQELRDEQLEYIIEEKPPIVLIAGGRPSQAKILEQSGIKTFLHVPTSSLLQMFLKEGAKRFVFEGRECGGHVGPLSSLVLWEKQITLLLQEEHPELIDVFFAGGIHDAISAAFVSVMTAPLAAKGVKVGVLMGTSYIYTKEAVETGAILQRFQDQAITHTDTVLLETAPGHETRCLNSAFTGLFDAEKNKLQKQNIDKKEIWAQLEQLNVGRLRIASKGIDRKGDKLVSVTDQEQENMGMYMIGQVTALRGKQLSMLELHKEVAVDNFAHIAKATLPDEQPESEKALNIAIIGMACIYPNAKNLDEYWNNIISGKDCIIEVPNERWNKDIYYDSESQNGDKTPSKWGGFIPKIDFDPLTFGIPPQSLAAIEPTQLLSLLVAKQALADAGYDKGNFDRENVSVIIGAEGGNDLANNYGFRSYFSQVFGEIPAELDEALPRLTEDSFAGILANVISGRIANRLDLGGRNFTVDAACASSLAALDLACQELMVGKSDMVIAGAADLHNGINDYLMFSSTHALSKTGKCSSFDASADGIALGEGVAMLVLKRYDDAIQDGDNIYAVIKGLGGSSDGKSLGLTAPRKAGQIKALERAYEQAGISASTIGLVEAHGTGTVVGDKTELSALSDMLIEAGAIAGQTHLGSVKTQIGHTKCAAGMAGIIKTALAVYHGVKPPTLNIKTPNAFYKPESSPFVFNTVAGPWIENKRRAGISAFGFGGTNFHAVIENNHAQVSSTPGTQVWPTELFVFRGQTEQEAHELLNKTSALLNTNDTLSLKDIAYSLSVYNDKPIQLAILANSNVDLLQKVEQALAKLEAKDIYYAQQVEGKVAFLFPGQGSQRINMARALFVAFPEMRKLFNEQPVYQNILFPPTVFDDSTQQEQRERIKDTRSAQPLLGVVDLAIASFLRTLGIQPDMVAGHSYGELPALCFAGAFDDNELITLSEKRAKAILDSIEDDKGIMVAVNGTKEILDQFVDHDKGVYAVNHNSPHQWVLAGATKAMLQLMDELTTAKVAYKQLEVACAFHSPLLVKSKELYQKSIEHITFRTTNTPVWSNTTTALYPNDPEAIKELLTEHLIKPVRFSEEVLQMYEDGARLFIEVGPGKVLSGLAKAILGKDELLLHTEDNSQTDITPLLSMLARYITSGRSINMEKLFEGRQVTLLQLDQPEVYKKSSTIWHIDGHMAIPAVGKLPAHGAMPIIEPLQLKGTVQQSTMENNQADQQIIHEFLDSMKQMVQAQRDVMLSYLGQVVPSSAPIMLQERQAKPTHQVNIETPASNMVQTTAPAASNNGQPVKAQAARTSQDIKELLISVVSDKTGYPPEMLGMDMDLEADLSIDSIKRMEIIAGLKTQLGGFVHTGKSDEHMAEQLASLKTLQTLLNWITENVIQQQDNIKTDAEKSPITEQANARPTGLTASQITTVLLDVVSEKTGYPQEMLGMELDLEADLSIDSIKRMEIIGELKNKMVGFNLNESEGEKITEQLAAIKTLKGLVGWLTDALSGSQETVEEAKKILEEGLSRPDLKQTLSRLRFQLRPSEFGNAAMQTIKGQKFAITDDGGPIALAIKERLEEEGAIANIVSEKDTLDDYNGLIILDIFSSVKRLNIMESFSTVKRLDLNKVKWIYVLSDLTGHTNIETDTKLLRHFQGYSGFLKSLDKEWEGTKCRTINLSNMLPPKQIAGITIDELSNTDHPSEVFYHNHIRQTHELVPTQLTKGKTSNIKLSKESVVLVLGGAQGITAELMVRFSKDYPCHYILVGRSADPRTEGRDQYVFLKNREEIKQHLITQGYSKKPSEIEKKTQEIYKCNQILHTITSLEKNGSTVSYHAIDLRDEQELGNLIGSIYTTYGRLDGVVHGAGLLEDKLFHHKTPESFERVFSTKVTPLRVLAEQLKPTTQFVILFSSVASVYGNRGQTDYAAANSVMDKYAWALNKTLGGKVISINWGPWKGAGMVDAGLEKEYKRRGIPLIPLQAGLEIFVNELKYGNESQVLIMAGSPQHAATNEGDPLAI